MKIGNDILRTLNYNTNKIRMVLNRSDAKTRIPLESVEKLLGEGFYHILPNDFQAASESIATGVPLVLGDSDGVLAEEIRKLISRYTNKAYVPEREAVPVKSQERRKSGFFGKIFGR